MEAEARRAGVKVTTLADIVHVIEYVWGAARAVLGESNAKAFHLGRDRARNHASRYEDGQIPDPLPAPKPRLKRGK